MRPIWSGSLAFGLVNIPIKLYSATIEHTLDFDMLHKKDLSPIRFARICKQEEKEVPWSDIIKGYDIGDGQYVVVTEEDFKTASPKESGAIEIQEFSSADEIDSIYFEKPYYIVPAKGAGKAYSLLCQALAKSKKVGVAKFVLRHREHLAIIKPQQDLLILNQLRFADEIRDVAEFETKTSEKATAREMAMALALIEQLTQPFAAENYTDTYTDQLKTLIKKKSKGVSPKRAAAAPKPSGKVVDLFATLKASLKPSPKKRPKQRKTA